MSKWTDAARDAIKGHTETTDIDDEGNPETALWHLLHSLIDYADQEGIDFKEVVENAMEEYAIQKANAQP
jgi:hypothetical protein